MIQFIRKYTFKTIKNGILSGSYFLYGIGCSFSDHLRAGYGQTTFFRDDYSKEVNYILGKLPIGLTYNDYGNWFGFFQKNPIVVKRLLQHIYTYDDSHEIYNHIKKSLSLHNQRHDADNKAENKKERELEMHKFVEKVMQLKHEYVDQIDPNFGACEECLKKIKWTKKVRKHKDTIENNPKFWDWTKWS